MNLLERCTASGLKMTGQRKTILEVLEEAHDHPSVDAIFERTKARDASISIATVYRTLSLLDEMDIVIRQDFKENFSRYDINTEHHHHLIDLDNGEVIEFQNQEIEDLKKKIAAELGYELVECKLELYGRKFQKNS